MYVNIGSNKVYYLVSSKKSFNDTPILFIHGAGATYYVWFNQLNANIEGYYQIALDMPGHGRSDGEGFKSIENYTKFVKDFIDTLSLKNLVLAGHSMGAAIAMNFAIKYPNLLHRLILVGAGAKLRVSHAVLDMVKNNENISKYAYSPASSPELIEKAEAEYYRTDALVRYNDLLACDQFDVMDKLTDIKIKTLIICGKDDMMTPPKYAQYLHDNIKESQLFIIEDAGHTVSWEKPIEVNKYLKDFLSQQ